MATSAATLENVKEISDLELIASAIRGGQDGFEGLVRRYQRPITGYIFRMLGDYEASLDVSQEVFIKVYRSLDKFRQDAQLSSWMYRIVMNACIDHRRRTMPSGAAPFGEEAEHRMMNTVEETPGPEERTYAGELGQVLEAEIGRLPPGQRIVFIMRHHQGLKLGEIAETLGLAEGTVKRQLHAAVHRLRAALAAVRVTAGEGA